MKPNPILFISLESWDDIWRRNQFFCAEWVRRDPARRIVFVTPARDVSNAIRRRAWGQLRHREIWSPEGLPGVSVFQPDKVLPNTVEACRRANVVHLRWQLRRVMKRLGLSSPVLWINDHSAHELAGTLGESAVVYDITDDWISFDQPEWLRERIRRQDADLCRRADAVIVCSERLQQMKKPLTDKLHLIANGVDAAHYAAVLDGRGQLPAAAERWKKPVYGYTGSLHADRVDVELVDAVARKIDGTLVFVGPDMLTAEQRAVLTRSGKVVVHGPAPYRELPQYMRAFDVCMVPHRVSEFTESLNPIKLWEYLAAGKPIVSTPVAGFRDYPQFVRLASGAEAFASALHEARDEGRLHADARRAEAAGHSWSARVDMIEGVIDGALSPRQFTMGAAHAR